MSRGAVTLFTVSALLLGFSGLWSGSRIVHNKNTEDGGIVQQHLDDFVQDSKNTPPLVRKRPRKGVQKNGQIGANEMKAVQHFETLSQTRKGGGLNVKGTVRNDSVKNGDMAMRRDARKVRGTKKKRAVHRENVSYLQQKVLEARASFWNASHVAMGVNGTIPATGSRNVTLKARAFKPTIRVAQDKSVNKTAITRTTKVEKKGTKPSVRQRKANLPSNVTRIEKERDLLKNMLARNVSFAEKKVLDKLKARLGNAHVDHASKAANATTASKVMKKKGTKPSVQQKKARLPSNATSTQKKRDSSKNKTTARHVSIAEKKALGELKVRLGKAHLDHQAKAANATTASKKETKKTGTKPSVQQKKASLPSNATSTKKKRGVGQNTTSKVSSTQKIAVDDVKAQTRKPQYLLQKPTHHACDGYRGVLLIQSGDQGAAAGTAFFQYVINQIIYAETYGFLPWVHFNNVSQHVYDPLVHSGANTTIQAQGAMNISWVQVRAPNKTKLEGMLYPGSPYGTLGRTNFTVSGTGVFESYFEPISDFRKGDKSCQGLPIITMMYDQLRGMHLYAPWAVRTWQYISMPPQYFISEKNQTLQQWFHPMRRKAHEIVQKYYRFQPHIIANVDQILPENETCLGMHIRHSDKWGARRQIPEDEFLPYVKTFIQSGGRTIYLATDSQNVIDTVRKSWPTWIQKHIRTQGDESVVRSTYQKPVFKMAEHHRTNTEVLYDILALSRCQWIIHGLSAVSESAIYLNLNLHNKSVNLEDPNRMNTIKFGRLVRQDLKKRKGK